MNIVLDTNILVSAVWSPGRNATKILEAVFMRKFTACYDSRILEEYDRVLHYPKLKFPDSAIEAVLEPILKNGISVIPDPTKDVPFERDETDRKFYEVAKFCNAVLVTGNLAHYPKDNNIILPSEFIERYL
jgi:uncharacterized protein